MSPPRIPQPPPRGENRGDAAAVEPGIARVSPLQGRRDHGGAAGGLCRLGDDPHCCFSGSSLGWLAAGSRRGRRGKGLGPSQPHCGPPTDGGLFPPPLPCFVQPNRACSLRGEGADSLSRRVLRAQRLPPPPPPSTMQAISGGGESLLPLRIWGGRWGGGEKTRGSRQASQNELLIAASACLFIIPSERLEGEGGRGGEAGEGDWSRPAWSPWQRGISLQRGMRGLSEGGRRREPPRRGEIRVRQASHAACLRGILS